MTTNNYDYSIPSLTDTPTVSASALENLPPEQQLPESFSKENVIVWQSYINGGRQYVLYKGIWCVDFLPGKRQEAAAWRAARLSSNENDFLENEYPDGTLQFVLNKQDSAEMMTQHNLRLSELRQHYEQAEEITPFFREMSHYIPADVSEYLTYNTLNDLVLKQRIKEDLQLFDTQVILNRPDRVFYNPNNGEDVAFYWDKADNLRLSYDAHALYRAAPLLNDLVEYGSEDQYTVARYPSGTVQFVVQKALADKLVEVAKSESALANKYNDSELLPTSSIVDDHPAIFETAVNLATGGLVSTLSLFGYQVNTEKKS